MEIYNFIVENTLRLRTANLLNNVVIDTKYIFISLWSIVHFLAGGLIFCILDNFTKLKTRNKFILLFLILLLYETIEYFLYNNLTRLFIVETTRDLIWDVIIGLLGGIVYWVVGKKN